LAAEPEIEVTDAGESAGAGEELEEITKEEAVAQVRGGDLP
jgi:hypothetical protein